MVGGIYTVKFKRSSKSYSPNITLSKLCLLDFTFLLFNLLVLMCSLNLGLDPDPK